MLLSKYLPILSLFQGAVTTYISYMLLTIYILRHHAVPFLFANFALTFILLLQFMMRFADKLVGKGLDAWVIARLISYNLAWMVVLVVPMAVLVSTLMAFGGMSQRNEITIMKSSGMSLYRMMAGPLLASLIVTAGLIYFNNEILPDANHEAKILMTEISQKKPTLSLEPNVFNQEVQGYAMLVKGMDRITNLLYDVTIYDYTNPSKNIMLTAKQGNLYFSPDRSKLMMNLVSGEIHEYDVTNLQEYRKIHFREHRVVMNAEQFSLQQIAPGASRGDRELGIDDMQIRVDSFKTVYADYKKSYDSVAFNYFLGDPRQAPLSFPEGGKQPLDEFAYSQLTEKVRGLQAGLHSGSLRVEYLIGEINKYSVEIQKKWSIPVACLIFIILGAPLGVMTRKGGFGMAASISLFFFLIYWTFLVGGEKLADRNMVSPFIGMWAANFVMGALGIYLFYKSAKESVVLDFSVLMKIIPKRFRPEQRAQAEE